MQTQPSPTLTAAPAPAAAEPEPRLYYKRGEITVISNETGADLVVPQIKYGGSSLVLTEAESIDLEKITRPALIENSGIDRLVDLGFIRFHPKGTNPQGKKRETIPLGSVAPMNEFDHRLNSALDAEDRRNAATATGNLRRGV